MHPQVRDFVHKHTDSRVFPAVFEVGGRDINGGVRDIINTRHFTSCDLYDGPGVDIVGNVCEIHFDDTYDLVVCLEVLEHAPDALEVIAACGRLAKPGGLVLFTAACDPRAPHSALDGNPIRPDEFYRNVRVADFDAVPGWGDIVAMELENGDIRVAVRKR